MTRQLNILQVDNSVVISLYVKIMLLSVTTIKQIEVAGTIKKAKIKLKNKAFDIVIMEIFLPDGNGIELLNWIKQQHPSVIVIVFTNDSDSFFKKNAERSGADYFLDKSTGFEMLVQIIKKHKLGNK